MFPHVKARQREMIKSYTTGAYSQTYNAYQQVIIVLGFVSVFSITIFAKLDVKGSLDFFP